jgi:hypothetical protein
MANAAPKKRPMRSRRSGLKKKKLYEENQIVIKRIEKALLEEKPKVKK